MVANTFPCIPVAREDIETRNGSIPGWVPGGTAQIAGLPFAEMSGHLWRKIAGMFADDADFDAWEAEIQSYGREQDAEKTTW